MDGLELDQKLLEDLCAFTGLTSNGLAKAANLSPSTIHRPITGKATSRLSQPTIRKLQARFPNFAGWNAFLRNDDGFELASYSGSNLISDNQNDDLVVVAQITPEFGLGAIIMDEYAAPEMRTFSRSWLRQITTSPVEKLYWARGRGNSMSPLINDGEPILIDMSENSIRDEDLVWAFAYGNVAGIKRLRQLANGSVRMMSDNTYVSDEIAHDDELNIFGRVVAVVKNI